MQDFNRSKSTAQAAGFGVKADIDQGLKSYMLQVYNYMAGALALSGIVAYMVGTNETLMQAIFGTPLAFVVMLAPLGFVWFFSAKVHSMQISTAQTCFWVFAGLMGLSLSYIFAVYTGVSITRVFFITASVFGAMSLYGYTTKKDLSGWGSFLFMGLIGLVVASLVNIFLKSSALDFAVSAIGVLVFTGLTAYDTQRIKQTYYQLSGDTLAKASIMGALSLYMDFINLFIMLLRFFGERR
jgi:hypothetical protein